jgi:hypothetical protein
MRVEIMKIQRKKFQELFPHLAKELERSSTSTRLPLSPSDHNRDEDATSFKFQGYFPNVLDFLRRCDNEEEGLEIISYLEERSEIDCCYAEKLRIQLKTEGIRSFGPKKEDDYYLKEAGYG